MPGYVVTGGTGELGRAVVRHLLARGDRVAVPYRNGGSWDQLERSFETKNLWGATADLSDLPATQRFFAEAVAWLGRLDGVAALAGGFRASGRFEAAPADEWDSMLRVNLASSYATCRSALPLLASAGGSIVTVISRSAEAGGSAMAAYAVSKMAVLALTRALALENRERGVRVNAISPAVIDTAANRAAMPRADRSAWTAPERIAPVVGFLLSPASAPVTGAVIPV
jgi:NAD(P)-dependent dehydrogenase (short-subunit alcohol dehydrogenase family)